jgi:hypothetical protein
MSKKPNYLVKIWKFQGKLVSLQANGCIKTKPPKTIIMNQTVSLWTLPTILLVVCTIVLTSHAQKEIDGNTGNV